MPHKLFHTVFETQLLQVRVSRSRIVSCARKIVEQLGYVAAMVEIEFYGEVGTGLGPTLEFYSILALELQATSLNMWRCPSIVSRAELFPDGTTLPSSFYPVMCFSYCFALQVSAKRLALAANPTAASTTLSLISSCWHLEACSPCRSCLVQRRVPLPPAISCSWASCWRAA